MTILFVPGFMADHTLWDDVIPKLDTKSVEFSDPSYGKTIEEMAEYTLANAPAQFDLVGFSMGGYIARAMVRLAPERVKRLVLIATSARGDTEEQKARKIAAVDFLNSTNTFRGLSRYSITGSLHTDRANDEVLINRIREMSVRLGRDVFTQQSLLVRDADLDSLSQIKCPTLILAGENDRIRSYEEAIELHKGISGSQLQVINHCGHMLTLEAAESVAISMNRFFDNPQ